MHESLLDDVIARAEIFASTDADDAPGRVLHIGRPIRAEVDWQCSHQITGYANEDAVMTAYGADSFQALCLCLKLVRARLRPMSATVATQVSHWQRSRDGIGDTDRQCRWRLDAPTLRNDTCSTPGAVAAHTCCAN